MNLATHAMLFAGRVFGQCIDWFSTLLDATGTRGIYLVALAIVAAFRLLVAPILGTALSTGSDAYQARHSARIQAKVRGVPTGNKQKEG